VTSPSAVSSVPDGSIRGYMGMPTLTIVRAHKPSPFRSRADKAEVITVGGHHTVTELLEAWLSYNEPNWTPKTLGENAQRTKSRLTPAFGHYFVDELSAAMLERQYREWLDEPSPTTVHHLTSSPGE